MPPNISGNSARLREIRTFPSLVKYLREELEWPVESDDFEELTFEWVPEELGIDPSNAAKIEEIKQLRPLANGQPWGIFFIKFEPKHLPIVALRRLLNSLVVRKRTTAQNPERRSWQASDLMFISSYGEGGHRQISFAHFSEPDQSQKHALSTLRVLGWDGDDTSLKLDYVARTLQQKLYWPGDEANRSEWSARWTEAFLLRPREVIQSSALLAIRLADLARSIRVRAEVVLQMESDRGPLTHLHKAFQSALIHDLPPAEFADMYAQTVTYGLFSAAVSRSALSVDLGLSTQHLEELVPVTNPFLREMLGAFLRAGGRRDHVDFDELGIQEVVELLNSPATRLDHVLRDFGNRTRQEDPVIHFYELFLSEYDKKKKADRGVFYTPMPVVSFIVRSVDEILRTKLGIVDGLASTDTWEDLVARCPGLQIPEGIDKEDPFVVVLDPAVGTATFLVEIVDLVHKTLLAKWKDQGLDDERLDAAWNDYVPQHLLPRLYGFELMMAPYAIAHVKIGLKLLETGYRFGSDARARVFLTNSLEPSHKWSRQVSLLSPALAHEAEAASRAKTHRPFTVILGNPPYSISSQNRNDWILELLEPYKQNLAERKINLDDDYIKFIRLATHLIEMNGVGIVCMITNNSFLDGVTHRQMRKVLIDAATEFWVHDLHGSSIKKEKSPDGSTDKNVFDIQQGVCLSAFVLVPGGSAKDTLRFGESYGPRESKYECLEASTFESAAPFDHLCVAPYFFFRPGLSAANEHYDSWLPLPDLFPNYTSGIQTKRDGLTLARTRHEIELVRKDFLSLPVAALRKKYEVPPDGRDWQLALAKKDVADNRPPVVEILYRPYDKRVTLYSGKSKGFIAYPRAAKLGVMVGGDNLAFVFKRQATSDQSGYTYFLVVDKPISEGFFAIDSRGREFLAPLYVAPESGLDGDLFGIEHELAINIAPGFIAAIEKATGLAFHARMSRGKAGHFGELDVFDFVYGLCWLPRYREENLERLRADFPRIPEPSNREKFLEIGRIGARFRSIHLLEPSKDKAQKFHFRGVGNRFVSRIVHREDRIYVNDDAYFEVVPPEVWDTVLGGYQVCLKWLKDRKGDELDDDDIGRFKAVLACLALHNELEGACANVSYP